MPKACSVSSTIDAAHAATINAGTYQTDIGTTTFDIICNDSDGFSVYAIGYSGSTMGNTKLAATVDGVSSPSNDIKTGLANSGTVSNWAMKLTPVSGAYTPTISNNFDDYKEIPMTYTKVATFTSATGDTVGASFKSTYSAFIAKTQPAGTYEGKVKYTMLYPNNNEPPVTAVTTEPGFISYNPNAINVPDTMADQEINPTATSIILWASNFQRPGYGFAGWNTKPDYSGTFYGPNETISFDAGTYNGDNNGLSLYAYWVKSAGTLQNWAGCPTLAVNGVTALTDSRDGNTYAVAKLADNKCWMIENFRLDDTATLTADDTQVFLQDSVPSDKLDKTNTSETVTLMTAPNQNIYSYGNKYTFEAVHMTNINRSKYAYDSVDICPKGWILPDLNSYVNLDSTLGGTGYITGNDGASLAVRKFPNNFIFANGDDSGTYWSSSLDGGKSWAYYAVAFMLGYNSIGVPTYSNGMQSYYPAPRIETMQSVRCHKE